MLWAWGGAENRTEQPEVSGGPGREGRTADQDDTLQIIHNITYVYLPNSGLCMQPQYSQKEDKYEEEIKVLTDKLKEVS